VSSAAQQQSLKRVALHGELSEPNGSWTHGGAKLAMGESVI
jgi:hypothetical protein